MEYLRPGYTTSLVLSGMMTAGSHYHMYTAALDLYTFCLKCFGMGKKKVARDLANQHNKKIYVGNFATAIRSLATFSSP